MAEAPDNSGIIYRSAVEERITLKVRSVTQWWLEFAKYLSLVVAIGVASAPSENLLVRTFSQITELALLAYVSSYISGWVIAPVHPKYRLARILTSAATTIVIVGAGYLVLGYAIETIVHELRRIGINPPIGNS